MNIYKPLCYGMFVLLMGAIILIIAQYNTLYGADRQLKERRKEMDAKNLRQDSTVTKVGEIATHWMTSVQYYNELIDLDTRLITAIRQHYPEDSIKTLYSQRTDRINAIIKFLKP